MLAKDIGEKQFKTTRLKEGYEPDEVDAFLDEVELDYARFQAEIDRLKAENVKLRNFDQTVRLPAIPAESPLGTAERLLRVAEQTADEHIAEAKSQAEEIVREAGTKGAKIVEEAQAAKQAIVAEAEAEAAEVRKRKDQLSDQCTQLETKRTTYKSWLRSMLQYMEQEEANGKV